ncbi:MAG TPA: hypothetical protein VJZ06_08530 [Mobilitalea sp.]|nr:hypothetical protein [Mobilitalea sp.]
MKKHFNIVLSVIILMAVLSACGGQNDSVSNTTALSQDILNSDNSSTEPATSGDKGETNSQGIFKVGDFINESDDKITKAVGGRAYELEVIPSFPDAAQHFSPSTEDYCLMCYPATIYREAVDTATQIAKFDLISWDASGEVDSHYQAFVFDSAEEADKYHEFRKERDGVKYRELYADSNLSDAMMTGCAKRYDNIIYYNMGFETVGMEEAYNKTYLTDEQSFYEGIGYSFLFSARSGEYDSYSHYVWTKEDNEYFYPVSHRFSISRFYESVDLDGIGGSEGVDFIEYTLRNYDEYGNVFSTSIKCEVLDEANIDALVSTIEEAYKDDENAMLESIGRYIFIYNNNPVTGNEDGAYFDLLGEEYMERDADYKDGQYPEAGMGRYYYFSYRDKECPTKVSTSKIIQDAGTEDSGKGKKTKTDTLDTGSFEAYFCSEEMDTVLNKPSCEMFVGKDGNQAILHIYEYRDGVVTYESKATGDYDEIFTPEQVSTFEADNLADTAEEMGEYVLTMIDKDNFVIYADCGTVMLDYLLRRAEHTVQ